MAIFKLRGNFLRELNSCWMGVLMNGVGVLTVLLTIIFPFNSSSFFPPAWAMFAVLLVVVLSVVGMGLAIRDFFQGERFVACLGFGLCGWPWALILASYLII